MIKLAHSPYGFAHQVPRMIVVHAMGEYIDCGEKGFLHAPDFLQDIGLSAHMLVAPDGTLYRCREDTEGAYHARGFNTDSLGIEVLVPGRHNYGSFLNALKTNYVSQAQYDALVLQCRYWMQMYGIDKVVRHSDLSPGRKVDPGDGFPWDDFLTGVKKGDSYATANV